MDGNDKIRKKGKNKKQGLIKTVILVIVSLLILSYFGINLRSIVESEAGKSNFSYTWTWLSHIWNNYLTVPFNFAWTNIVVPIWDFFWVNFSKIMQSGNFVDTDIPQ